MEHRPTARDQLDYDLYGFASHALYGIDRQNSICRQTGRTTRMVKALRPNDLVITLTAQHRRHIEDMAKSLDVDLSDVMIVITERAHIDALGKALRGRVGRRVVYDHEWTLAYTKAQLVGSSNVLKAMAAALTEVEPL